jgi:crotonobetainyl-CoA:carnitine CoA-transferase CaiB-like acyl-CoA transferase
MNNKPFIGLKVIELASVLAGPAVGMFFAELGADVLKIERPGFGDVTRKWKLPHEVPAERTSAYFAAVNWGKKYLDLDIASEYGQVRLHELLQDADILIVNFKPGDENKLGLNPDKLLKEYPKLLIGQITGYGPNNPRPAFDLVLQAETGFMSMNGTPESGPLKMPVAFIDLFCAHQLKEALLIGLLERTKTGKGGLYNVSLYDSAIASLANQASNYLTEAFVPQLQGSLHPNISPYGETFTTIDGHHIVLAIGNDEQFKRLMSALRLDFNLDLHATNTSRVKNRSNLFDILNERVKTLHLDEIRVLFDAATVPYGVIKSIPEVLDERSNQHLILTDLVDGKELRRVKSVVYKIQRDP